MKSCIKPFQKRSGNNNLRILHYSDFSGHIIRYIVIKALLINMKLEMQFWDQVSLLSLLMLTEYMLIKTCVLFLCFCEGAFPHAMSHDTRLSALLVSRKREMWVATFLSYWWEPTWDVCWRTSVYTSRWPTGALCWHRQRACTGSIASRGLHSVHGDR